ncbi:DNA cytosine methyltransferase [Clostridium polynesiense]|uniref:DNA cytosine methyltransferase n=1 Tax=Clostridium polynesiense TaxID=1325933 RepID=UPI00058F4D4D|nr:DNA cytosine methyltransferase [Clostridium polynesiense]
MYTSIDLFSGPGGLCTGFKWAGIKPLIAVEWSGWTVQTYASSHDADIFELEKYLDGTLENADEFFKPNDKTLIIHGDINKVKIELIIKILNSRFNVNTVDVVSGGAPCESFSLAGDRKEDDDRNNLFLNILRIARGVDAPMIVFENVKGLFSKKLDGIPGKMFEEICKEFESSKKNSPKYKLASKDKDTVLLKAADFGVPQNRERLFLVAINKKYRNAKFSYPRPTHGRETDKEYVTVADALLDLPQIDSGQESEIYDFDINSITDRKRLEFLQLMRGVSKTPPIHLNYNRYSISSHKSVNHRENMRMRMALILPGENMEIACTRLTADNQEELVDMYFPKKKYAARNRRLKEDEPSFTVTSHCLDEMIHPTLNRALTPREAARLQSFPDWYVFEGPYVKFHSDPEQDRYEQIGDAIPPLLAYNLAKEIVKTLNSIFNNVNIREGNV